jgi:hypothetical protein
MQSRLLALPELKKRWLQSVATPVFRLRDQTTVVPQYSQEVNTYDFREYNQFQYSVTNMLRLIKNPNVYQSLDEDIKCRQ